MCDSLLAPTVPTANEIKKPFVLYCERLPIWKSKHAYVRSAQLLVIFVGHCVVFAPRNFFIRVTTLSSTTTTKNSTHPTSVSGSRLFPTLGSAPDAQTQYTAYNRKRTASTFPELHIYQILNTPTIHMLPPFQLSVV